MRLSYLLAAGLVAATALAGCNSTPLTPLGDTLQATTNDLSPEIGSNKVDILWMIDSSGSMRDEQAELALRFADFITALIEIGADFQIAVVTTDIADRNQRGRMQSNLGCVGRSAVDPALIASCESLQLSRPYLEYSSYTDSQGVIDATRLERDFRCLASVGVCGDANEAGIETVLRAFSPELLSTVNAGFLRDDAYLAVIFLTDEDDCSFNGAATAFSDADCYASDRRDLMIDVQQAYDQLIALKGGDATRVLLAGIIGPDGGRDIPTREEINRPPAQGGGVPISCNYQRGDGEVQDAKDGRRYRDLIRLAGERGIEESICEADFRNALRKIGQVLRDNLDVNCLQRQPATCATDRDCNPGVACINPGDPAVGSKFCADFELYLEVNSPSSPGVFTEYPGPGPAGQSTPDPGARYLVDFDATNCARGVAFSFEDGARPSQGARYRAAYPLRVDVVTADQVTRPAAE